VSAAALATLIVALATPPLLRAWWSHRSSNPVRRGVARAAELGCFHCHGFQGSEGIAEPAGGEVPSWSGGVWMMYVEDPAEVRQFILDGVSVRRAHSASATAEREAAAIRMPAYREVLRGTDLEDLTAAFLVLSGMRGPGEGTAARRGLEIARERGCFGCHGPAGSGGLPNPRSFAGFVPGWYGADFRDMVRDRREFDAWLTTGTLERLEDNPLAARFLRRQRVRMPAYRALSDADRDALWAYVRWLGATGGGVRGEE
jgi:mono/diheme cytochrome c family protein